MRSRVICGEAAVSVTGLPVCLNAFSIADARGRFAWSAIANAPATCGVAIEVPSKTSKFVPPGPVPVGTEELIPSPGAKKSTSELALENEATTSLLLWRRLSRGRDAAGRVHGVGEAVVAGGDHGRDPRRAQVVDRALRGSVSQAPVNLPPPMLMFTEPIGTCCGSRTRAPGPRAGRSRTTARTGPRRLRSRWGRRSARTPGWRRARPRGRRR